MTVVIIILIVVSVLLLIIVGYGKVMCKAEKQKEDVDQ